MQMPITLLFLSSVFGAASRCKYNAGVQWTALPLGVHVMPCSTDTDNTLDPLQKWAGETLTHSDGEPIASAITNAGTPGYCLGVKQDDPVTMSPCTITVGSGFAGGDGGGSTSDKGVVNTTGAKFVYNHVTRTLGIAGDPSKCLNINHDTGSCRDTHCHLLYIRAISLLTPTRFVVVAVRFRFGKSRSLSLRFPWDSGAALRWPSPHVSIHTALCTLRADLVTLHVIFSVGVLRFVEAAHSN
jgi:hypothetical protein